MFAQLEDFPNAQLYDDIPSDDFISYEDDLSIKEKRKITKEVISDLNTFYVKIAFDNFLNKNEHLYKRVICISVFNHTPVMLAITSLSNNFSPKYLLFNLYTNSSR